MFKNHLEMIGRNETPSKKAKFWQSYIRSLKGSEDIRAQETPRSRAYRPLSSLPEFTPSFRSIYDDPNSSAAERITGAGYRYLPVHRDTYGYSPRNIYAHNRPASTVDTKAYDPDKAWNEHLDRVANIEKRYPSRYGLYLKDKPLTTMWPLEYEPENKPDIGHLARAGSLPPMRDGRSRSRSVSPLGRSSLPRRLRATSLEPVLEDIFDRYDIPMRSSLRSPTPIKFGRWAPRDSEVAFNAEGVPIFPRLSPTTLHNLFNPRPWLPLSAITRDPWWYNYPALRPFDPYVPYSHRSPFFLRDSFLSPVKRRYLWVKHPLRPFAHVHSY